MVMPAEINNSPSNSPLKGWISDSMDCEEKIPN